MSVGRLDFHFGYNNTQDTMGIKSDRWIRRMAEQHGMIAPFEPQQVRYVNQERVISFGTSSYGYDVRCSDEFKIFTNINSAIVDPKNFDESSFVNLKSDVCIIPPNSFALARTVEFFRIPRDVLTICLGKSTYARCFRGDTRVSLVDGTTPTLEEMARRAEQGEMFWGYSIGENGRLIVTLLDTPRYIGRDSLVEVTLDNNETICCTPDHLFMLRDGCWQAAGELQSGASLMPLYRYLQRGYEMVYQPLNGHLYPTHRLADEWNLRNGIYADQTNTHRYHVDFDRLNNNPWNILRMDAGEHMRLHNEANVTSCVFLIALILALSRREREITSLRRDVISCPALSRRERELKGAIWDNIPSVGCYPLVWRLAAMYNTAHGPHPSPLPQGEGVKVIAVCPLAGNHDVFCLTVPEAGNFALESGVFVHNCGIIVNVTPLEPEWEGHVTLEFSNTTTLPAKIYANEGVAQVLFIGADEVCETSYKDRGGKYQGQTGVTLPKA